MRRVAIIVQRCHEDVVGGSETLAWHYAQLLSDAYEVDVLTTTAIDTSDWANVLPEGSEFKDGVRIVRFPVTIGRSRYWSGLHDRLVAEFGPFVPTRNHDVPQLSWTIALQEDLIRHQGPYSEPLLRYLNERWRDHRALIFITYLYPTTYFGLQQIPLHRALFAPTLHDELPAYLPAYKYSARRARELVWLTGAEQRVGQKLWGELPGRVVSMAIDTKIREPQWMPTPYILFSGRVDPNKGCVDLFDYFITFKKIRPSSLRLVITGKDDIPVPRHEDIDFRGFVTAEEKFRLMAGAMLFVNPSPNESFSIVTLEAMAQRTPVLANGASEVLADHVKDSGAGRVYVNYPTFATALTEMLSDQNKLREIGGKGREYVTAVYDRAKIQKNLIESIEQIPESNTHSEPHPVQAKLIEAVEAVEAVKRRAAVPESFRFTREEFEQRFEKNLRECEWREHAEYSPFSQFDQEYYVAQREAFVHKYRCFYAVSRTILPRSIIELGACAGSSADAYLSASPHAKYLGLDLFGANARHDDGSVWYPLDVAKALLSDRGFANWTFIQKDLRMLQSLPEHAELVVVDAAHDFYNEYEDLKLALTANPTFIFVDDADDEDQAKPAVEKFLREDLSGRVEYTVPIDYVGGGLVIKLRK